MLNAGQSVVQTGMEFKPVVGVDLVAQDHLVVYLHDANVYPHFLGVILEFCPQLFGLVEIKFMKHGCIELVSFRVYVVRRYTGTQLDPVVAGAFLEKILRTGNGHTAWQQVSHDTTATAVRQFTSSR